MNALMRIEWVHKFQVELIEYRPHEINLSQRL